MLPLFAAKELPQGYRRAPDGLLERQVNLPAPIGAQWVPIVPEGHATSALTWKRWMFLQCHVGLLGAHRNEDKTLVIISRQAWWATRSADVHEWWNKCLTCLRFRGMPRKQESVALVPVDAECWEEVMIDLDGPSNPEDKQGNKYTMTYICCVCHGIITDRAPRASAAEARRMFACCALRSGMLPTLVRSPYVRRRPGSSRV